MVEWIINVMIYGIIFTLIGLVFAIFIFYMTYDPLTPYLEEKLAERKARREREKLMEEMEHKDFK